MESTALSPESLPAHSPGSQTPRKLRDSCHHCAASKLKCSREKPTCARCAKRGKKCQYVLSRRAGRAQTTRLKASTSDSASSRAPSASGTAPVAPRIAPHITPAHTSISPQSLSPDTTTHAPLTPATGSFPEMLPPLMSPADDSPFEPSPTALGHPFFDFDDASMAWSAYEFPITTSRTDPEFTMMPHDPNSYMAQASMFPTPTPTLPATDEAFTEVTPLHGFASQTSNNQAMATSYRAHTHGTEEQIPDARCSCMVRSLGMLQQLSASTRGLGEFGGLRTEGNVAIQSTLAENKQHIQASITMAECPCSEDVYLLSFLAFIMFKVLGSYRAMLGGLEGASSPVSASLDGTTSPMVLGEHSTEDDEQFLMTSHVILGELHHIQWLITMLSPRLKSHGSATTRARADAPGWETAGYENRDYTRPFSPNLLSQLELDLRRSLWALSSNIADVLRRG